MYRTFFNNIHILWNLNITLRSRQCDNLDISSLWVVVWHLKVPWKSAVEGIVGICGLGVLNNLYREDGV